MATRKKAVRTKSKKTAASRRRIVSKGSRRSVSKPSKTPVIDVREKGDVDKLMKLIQKNKVVLVLVYADWCGHCKTFKKDVWSKLKSQANRKVPLAEVNADMLPNTPLKNAKIDGYPSVVPIGNDMKMATLKDASGKETNAIPNSRDTQMMESLVASDPEKVIANVNAPAATAVTADPEEPPAPETVPAPEPEPSPKSATPTPEAIEAKNNNALNSLGATVAEGSKAAPSSANPPDIEDDLLATQGPRMESGKPLNSKGEPIAASKKTESQEGGSLYAALVDAAKITVPLAALTAVATRSRRRGHKRRGRSSRRAATKIEAAEQLR
jgi:thiol-disulfide isomerase/thioredoxin